MGQVVSQGDTTGGAHLRAVDQTIGERMMIDMTYTLDQFIEDNGLDRQRIEGVQAADA